MEAPQSTSKDSDTTIKEINYWKERRDELQLIRKQLQQPEVERIVSILSQAKSSHTNQFVTLARKVLEAFDETNDNLKFLQLLYEPCTQLQDDRKPLSTISSTIVPQIIDKVRFIWIKSRFYNTRDRLTQLYRKIFNEIIARLTKEINLTDVFQGQAARRSRDKLEECEKLLQHLKSYFIVGAKVHHSRSNTPWILDQTTIFAEVDGFLQRCRDLSDVCTSQITFLRVGPNNDQREQRPIVHGRHGPDIERGIKEAEQMYLRILSELEQHGKHMALDPRELAWFETFNTYKHGLKAVEALIVQSLDTSFEHAGTIKEGVDLLQIYHTYISREPIRRAFDRRTRELYKMFNDDLLRVKRELGNRQRRPLYQWHPNFAGLALWAQELITRVEQNMRVVDEAFFLPQVGLYKNIKEGFEQVCGALQLFIKKCFLEWTKRLALANPTEMLQVPLIKRSSGVTLQQGVGEKGDAQKNPTSATTAAQDAAGGRSATPTTGGAFQLPPTQNKNLLEVNFKYELLIMFQEIMYWSESLKFEIPLSAMQVFQQSQDLFSLRETVTLLVKFYNKAVGSLSPIEAVLFKDQINLIDKKYQPAINKFDWTVQASNIQEYVNDCQHLTEKIGQAIRKFHEADKEITVQCKQISKVEMFYHEIFDEAVEQHAAGDINTNMAAAAATATNAHGLSPADLPTPWQLMRACKKFLQTARKDILAHYREIQIKVFGMKKTFKFDGEEIMLQAWLTFCRNIDARVEKSLTIAVKNGLHKFVHATTGSDKQHPHRAVIVRVLLSLETKQVTLHPTWQRLMFCFNAILQNFTNCVASMSRIVDIVNPIPHQPKTAATVHGAAESDPPHTAANAERGSTDAPGTDVGAGGDVAAKSSQELPLHKKVEQDELVVDMRKLINDKLTEQSLIIDELLKIWRRYSDIWTVDKMTTIEHLELSGFTTLHIERMMKRYTELSTQIDSMDQIAVTGFILLDFDLLKKAVIAHCRRWKQCYSEMLFNKALKEYLEMKTFLLTNAAKLLSTPTDLQEFGRAVELHKKLVEMAPTIEARFPPLDEMYTVLRKYYLADVSPTTLNNNLRASDDIAADDEPPIQPTMSTGPSAMLYLKDLWQQFKAALATADESLKEAKDKFKDDLYAQNERFRHAVQDMLAEFEKNGPYRTRANPPAAHEYIKTVRSYIENMKAQEKNILSGLSLFGIDAAVSVDLQRLESDLSKLKEIWNLNDHWEKKWNFWKSLHITQLQESELEKEASETLKSLGKLRREVSATWTIVGDLLREVDEFRKTLPLVTDLRNAAMRERHWRSIKDLMQAEFDEQSEAFSLQLIVQELQMSQRAEDISAVSIAATKELQIEQALKRIQTTWGGVKGLQLTIVPHLRKGQYKLKPSEEISQKLDEDNVTLSTVKPSRYAKPFAETISIWEKKLSLISETIEVICVVQRAWMYLEQVFMGDDIRRQLPMETVQFEEVNDQYCTLMQTLNEDRRCIRLADDMPDLIKTLDQMQAKLERVQRSLEMYLEIKRQNFPRFYFISNDDLLEVLGQTRDPEAVQFIFPKCFANINEIFIQKTGQRQIRHEATAMKSSDNEIVEFGQYKVLLSPPVESWLLEIERAMRSTLRAILTETRNAMKKMGPKRLGLDAWLKAWPGQLTLTASQIQYTSDVTKSLIIAKETGNKAPLRATKKRQLELLDQLSEIIRNPLVATTSANELDDAKDRAKLAAMIVLEVHGRDVLEKLIKLGVDDPVGFEWICQLRFYWDKDKADCVVRQNKAEFLYGYEYIGNPGRLVITPLTDRCYMTLTNALFMNRGGSPKGPAGTGKTETVKDLGRALGQFVIVINCSEGLDYKSMGRMFAGLAQSGLWGCFDEFNRINIEVLSVVAQQILCILSAMSAHAQRFTFEGHEIKLNMACGVFITMNPGYAGRTELPDNLKAQFRPIAMVVPDSTMIAEIILFGEGFQNTKILAKKVFTLYQLAIQQLSKQFHYDFGLRGLVAVLRYAGKKKRALTALRDDEVLLLAMRDMNVAKLTAADLPLFNGIVNDLFPETDPPVPNYDVLLGAVKKSCEDLKLQVHEPSLQKTIQLYETINSRHSVMVVGESGTGKTSVWKCLQGACNSLKKQNVPSFVQCAVHPINPKSITLGELYGQFDHATNEWRDGILSATMRMCCTDRNPIQHWIMFDGPVDTLWIESMNSVMDDNKVLTLINGERIKLTNYVLLLFEVGDLSSASPATVSRCGMVFFDYADLGYEPLLQSWLQQKSTVEAEVRQQLVACVDKLLRPLLKFMREQKIDLGGILEWNAIQTFTRLCDVIFSPTANNLPPLKDPMYLRVFEMFFIFCSIWSIGGAVDEDDRKKIDNFIREHDQSFPNRETIYEYFVNTQDKSWVHWEQQLNSPEGGAAAWQFDGKMPFYKLIVPTVDTQRYAYLIRRLVNNRQPVLVTGPVGTGKTSIIQEVVNKLDRTHWMLLAINLSARTTSANVQNIIESRLEKRLKGIYQPIGGRVMLCVLDDFNMPQKDSSGSQPPLELVRQWLDYGFWYDRARQSPKHVQDITLMAAQGPPGGGRQVISSRVKSRFSVLNLTFPQQSQIRRIYGTMLTHKLEKFSDEAKGLTNTIVDATLEMYNAICQKMLPTPTKIHYLFNMRDISKVFQGLLRSDVKLHDARASLTRLWIHETYRTFCDRLVDEDDRQAFFAILQDKLGTLFNTTFGGVCPDKYPPIFCDFISSHPTDDPDKPRPYQDVQDTQQLKRVAEVFLEDKNSAPGNIPMKLILFRDAIEYVTRIVRVIEQPRGNMLLIGMGGSGRQSLARLAAFICGYKCFSIEVTKNYRHAEFREDIKKLYWSAGVLNRPTVFLMNDKQVVEPSFLEDIHNILSSGEVTSLYKPEEFEEVRRELAEHVVKAGFPDTADSIFAFLIDRVRYNIRIVLCFSPIGREFRDYIRMYPAIVSCTTICFIDKWPEVALLEVADRLLMSVPQMDDANVRTNIAKVMAIIHRSVEHYLVRMFREHKRQNYVTPTNYLELVNGYIKTLAEKRQEIGGAITKLRNGVLKIVETTEKVEVMSIELADAKVKVFQFQAQCDEYLVSLVQEKKQADEQQKSVAARSEKIQIEKAECEKIAKVAEDELSEAMPLLDEANKALEALNKKDITEIKSYGRPPTPVELVLEAVLILRQNEPSWAEAKKQLADANFIRSLMDFDKDHIPDRVLKKVGTYVKRDDFQPEYVGKISTAAKSLCLWVRAMEAYGRIYRVVEPKRLKWQQADAALKSKLADLESAERRLDEINRKVGKLKEMYEQKLKQKEELKARAQDLETKLDRAAKLVAGLADERDRWEAKIEILEDELQYVVGDCLVAAAFLSYCGPFLSEYREQMTTMWLQKVQELEIPCTPSFSFGTFLCDPNSVREWNIQGLPSDSFSTENGIIVTRGARWPLIIDPQGQALKWIRRMEEKRQLKIIDPQMPDYMRIIENAIVYGIPVLLKNVQEELDPSLEPVLSKSIMKKGNLLLMKLGDKEVEYNPEFRFYMVTKMSNPHYSPEVSTKTTIVNFAVKEQGLEEQLLSIVVSKLEPELQHKKEDLVVRIASGKKRLVELEDVILKLLNESEGSLLEDESLVRTLQTSKSTSIDVSEQLATSETTEKKIDTAREQYRPSAQRSSILFFVINDLSKVDPMYTFSLDAYIQLYGVSIDKSQRSNLTIKERILTLNNYHTEAVYRYVCRGLFERHKLLFSFHMCVKILESQEKLVVEEYKFFLRGAQILDRSKQQDNPCNTWLPNTAWDNVTELERLPGGKFRGIANSFEQFNREWQQVFQSPTPEHAHFPGEWEATVNQQQRMLIIRSIRPDRTSAVVTTYVATHLGHQFVEPPVLHMKTIVADSNSRSPIVFILSPGADPVTILTQQAEIMGMSDRLRVVSLGQGQAPVANRLLQHGIKNGDWVFLANCHLSLSWMPELEKFVDTLQTADVNSDFRLWLSSDPSPDFPISILQAGIKLTTEPPKGVKANLKRLYNMVDDRSFPNCSKPSRYKRLLFSLCFFHTILIERRKFGELGFNISYSFNDSDFQVSENLLSVYLDQYEEIPWDALKFIIAEINYGGHVTDDWDRRLLQTYANDFFNTRVTTEQCYHLTSLKDYYIPLDGSLSHYKEYVSILPQQDHPEVFGQHPNAEIASEIRQSDMLFATLLSLRPQGAAADSEGGGGGNTRETSVLQLSADIRDKLPDLLEIEAAAKLMGTTEPLNVVLFQEMERYNAIMKGIKSSLAMLEKGIHGLVVMSTDLENIFNNLYFGQVPASWGRMYPSTKGLGNWTRDLVQRVEQLKEWATTTHPPILFWLAGFTFPTGFLTAVLQTAARKNNLAVDALGWDFSVLLSDDVKLRTPAKDGIYVRGMYLEGAGWDFKMQCLQDPLPMMLVTPMPVVHFKPTEMKRTKQRPNYYTCPCYYYPVRADNSKHNSFIVGVDLRSGQYSSDHWVKRGAALLLSLSY